MTNGPPAAELQGGKQKVCQGWHGPRPIATDRGHNVRDLDPKSGFAFDNATPRTDGGQRGGIAVIVSGHAPSA